MACVFVRIGVHWMQEYLFEMSWVCTHVWRWGKVVMEGWSEHLYGCPLRVGTGGERAQDWHQLQSESRVCCVCMSVCEAGMIQILTIIIIIITCF